MRGAAARLLRGSMHEVTARLSGLLLAVLLVVAVGAYGVLHFGLFQSGTEYRAEFTDAWPLVAGMDVRVSGVVAGSVRKVALTSGGTAEVTFQLNAGTPAPRADASVAIVQDDLLGDTSLELEPGTSAQALRGPISRSRSIHAPRLDDFIDIFRKPVRAGLQTLIVELGTAMRDRGVDLNDAILHLRPGFEALDAVLAELRSQNQALAQVIGNAHAVTSQLAPRTADLDRLVLGFERTVAGTAARSAALDAGLAQLPATLSETDTMLRQVRPLTAAVSPLAQTIVAAAPDLQRASRLLGPYADAISRATKQAAPSLRLAGEVLRGGARTVEALNRVGLAQMLNPTGGLFSALGPIISKVADGIFGTNQGGGLGGVVVPGNDLTETRVDPARTYLSVYATVTCDAFGLKQEPGCLSKALNMLGPPSPEPQSSGPAAAGRRAAVRRGAPAPRAGGSAPADYGASPPAPHAPSGSGLTQILTGAAQSITGGGSASGGTGAGGSGSGGGSLSSLLNYLLGH